MSIEKFVIEFLEEHPGASSKQIMNKCYQNFVTPERKVDAVNSMVSKKLRVLKKQNKVYNKCNSWFVLNRRAN